MALRPGSSGPAPSSTGPARSTPYAHRKIVASPASRIARMVPAEVVPLAVRQTVVGILRRSRNAAN